jgi:hypothetical protein
LRPYLLAGGARADRASVVGEDGKVEVIILI